MAMTQNDNDNHKDNGNNNQIDKDNSSQMSLIGNDIDKDKQKGEEVFTAGEVKEYVRTDGDIRKLYEMRRIIMLDVRRKEGKNWRKMWNKVNDIVQ